MKVYINHIEIQTFNGARLSDALLRYSKDSYKQLMAKQIWLEDEHGNAMESDGRLWDGIQLFIKTKQNDQNI